MLGLILIGAMLLTWVVVFWFLHKVLRLPIIICLLLYFASTYFFPYAIEIVGAGDLTPLELGNVWTQMFKNGEAGTNSIVFLCYYALYSGSDCIIY